MPSIFVCGDVVNMFAPHQFVGKDLRYKICSSDYAIANLEGCVYNGSGVVPKMMQHPDTLCLLKEAGFRMLLLANNHIGDYGEGSMAYTIEEASKQGFRFIGAGFNYDDIYRPQIVDVDGLKLGVINLCEAHPHYYHSKTQRYGYAWIGDPGIETRICDIKNKTDRTIAFIHGGLEHSRCPLVYFRDYYHWLCDCGVDIVVGGHPHIVQGIERYGEKLIFYSLGNFFFPRSLNADSSDVENHAFSVLLEINKEQIGYEVVYHKMDNLKVDVEPEDCSPFKERDLSAMLLPDNYRRIHADTVKKCYEGLISNLYRSSLNSLGEHDSFTTRLKTSVKYLFSPSRMKGSSSSRHKNFVHLINNETYRFIVNEYFKEEYAREYE